MTTQDGQIEPATITADEKRAKVELSFGPEGWIEPTDDGTGFVVVILRNPPGPFSVPVAKLRVTFGPDLKPVIEQIEVRRD